MKKCNRVMEKYLQQENENISLMLRLHMLFCPHCQKEIKSLQTILCQLKTTSSFHIKKDFSKEIMMQVKEMPIPSREPINKFFVSTFKWLFAGTLLVVSMILMPYNEVFLWTNWHFGRNFQITLHMMMGLTISAYFALFAIAHIEDFKKYTS